ncbi:MAG: hypothetical protein M1814_000687 [Vezdaea aestivalis]|nr:MAG: hypothetical protein M1814_000687 [Vezdaea aestivalis]
MDIRLSEDVELQKWSNHDKAQRNFADRLDRARRLSANGPLLSRRDRQWSTSTFRSTRQYTIEEERKVIKKLDRNVTLFLALLYLLSFLDRSNIGNARIAGLTEDLSLSSNQYEWLLTGFYITYILFEWMALLYRVVPAHIYITLCVAAWGLVASLQSLATSFESLFALRALLGITEAAFGPGAPLFLSFFFKQDELALRVGFFISAAPLSTSFASSLAWVITKTAKRSPIAPWRCLFLVEGFPSVLVAVLAYSTIPDSPSQARFLNRREREIACSRLGPDISAGPTKVKMEKLVWSEVFSSLKDRKIYVTAVMLFCCNVAFSSLPVFLPTIIEEMGYDAISSQALSAPPYIVAFFTTLLVSYLSDLTRNRSTFVCITCVMAAFGYAMVALTGWLRLGPVWRYIGVYLATAGFFSAITVILSWTINMHQSHSKRGAATAIVQYIGQCGPLLGTRLYPDEDKPYFVKGMSICSGFMLMVALLSWALHRHLARLNRVRDQRAKADLTEELDDQSSNAFRYLT